MSGSDQRFGVSPPETLRTMSGLAFLRAIIAGELPMPPICQSLGFALITADDGRVVFAGETGWHAMNPIGSIHGGFAATLLDSCLACSVHSTLPEGRGYTTLEIKINMVRGMTAETGLVRAIGEVVHRGRQISTAEGRLIGADGKLYAHGSTTCMCFDF